uniref:Inositol polyphosphate-related phosphatase domain-containing protein n=1 Tax=Araucaria cunninghamii TaxID=56994 RepID=A0A0D6R359_ARACU
MGNCVCKSLDRNRVKENTVSRNGCRGMRDLRVFPGDEGIRKSFEDHTSEAETVMDCQKRACEKKGIHREDIIERAENKSGLSLNGGPDLCLYTVTWNMNSKVACHDLLKLLGGERGTFDFYVVGLQEAPKVDIASSVLKVLGPNYSLVKAAVMQSLRLYIFGRKCWDPFVRDVKVDRIRGGGLGSVVGRQKGAVAISFSFMHTSFLFISCHLAPHEGNVDERNSQYKHIGQTIFSKSCRKIQSPSCLQSPNRLIRPSWLKKERKTIHPNSLERSDVVVWLGDLNYRIEGSRRLVGSLINENLQQLRAQDQLSREANKGEIFHRFFEGPLSFPPTYKYDIGTDDYDTSTKKRIPSWTDRILYRINSPGNIKAHVEDYDCIDSIKASDHRPVKSHLCLKFRRPLVDRLQSTTA